MDVHGLLNHLTIYWRKKGQQALLWFGGINNSKHERSSNKHLPIAKQSKIKKENKLKIGSNSGPVVFALFSSLPPRFLGSWFAPLASQCPLSVEGGSKSGWDDLGLSQRLYLEQSSTLFQKCFCKSFSLIGLIIKEIKTSQNHLFLLPQALLRPSAHHHFRSSRRCMGDGWRLWSLSRGPNWSSYLWRPFTGRENLWAEKHPKLTNADQLRGNSYFNVLVGVMSICSKPLGLVLCWVRIIICAWSKSGWDKLLYLFHLQIPWKSKTSSPLLSLCALGGNDGYCMAFLASAQGRLLSSAAAGWIGAWQTGLEWGHLHEVMIVVTFFCYLIVWQSTPDFFGMDVSLQLPILFKVDIGVQ